VRPWTEVLAGRVDERLINAPSLEGNLLGDPATRPIAVYLPPGYDDSADRYPVIYVLHGFGSYVTRWSNRPSYAELTAREHIDAVFGDGAPGCLVAYVDAFTSVGGSQYVDSPGTGRYHSYLTTDVVSFVDAEYRTLAQPQSRAVLGQSSGGIGAITAALLRPDVFGAFAAHAPDACFDLTLRPDLALAHRALRDLYDSSYEAFFSDFAARLPKAQPNDAVLLLVWAMAACYSADPNGTVRLPFDLETGAVVSEVWQRWLAFDPVVLVPAHEDSIRQMRAIWLDAGRRDEHLLDLAAEIVAARIEDAGPDDFSFELYEGTHRDYQHRFAKSVHYLAERLARAG
jgi:S-formylglutathione hydrolase FrmB